MTLPSIPAIDWPTVSTWALAGVLALAFIAAAVRRRTPKPRKDAEKKASKAPVVLAGGVALLASAMSVQAQWGFLGHALDIENPWQRGAFVGVFDLTGISAALLAREARTSRPGAFGADSLIVWAIALLLGYLGSTEATSDPGRLARWAVPLVAALMWDRVIQRDVQRAAGINKAAVATLSGRVAAAVARTAAAARRAITHTLARWGLLHPEDENATTIRRNRWHRQLVGRAARAADALREIEATSELPNDDKRRLRAADRYNKAVPPFRATIVAGQQLGAIANADDLNRILWDAAVVIRAEDALTQATGRSPWSTDRPGPVATDRPSVIDGEVIDRPTKTDRSTPRSTDQPQTGRRSGRPTNLRPDRPTDQTGRPPSDRQTTG